MPRYQHKQPACGYVLLHSLCSCGIGLLAFVRCCKPEPRGVPGLSEDACTRLRRALAPGLGLGLGHSSRSCLRRARRPWPLLMSGSKRQRSNLAFSLRPPLAAIPAALARISQYTHLCVQHRLHTVAAHDAGERSLRHTLARVSCTDRRWTRTPDEDAGRRRSRRKRSRNW